MSDTSRIHFFYVIAALVATIILLVTVEWGGIQDLVDYITFALTLSSLVLAAVAIVYALFSSASLAGTAESIREMSTLVSNTTRQLSEASEELTAHARTVPEALTEMGQSLERTRELMEAQNRETDVPQTTDRAAKFAGVSSFAGASFLYGCSIAHEKQVPLSISGLASAAQATTDYCLGFLVATTAGGFLQYRSGEEEVNITYIDKALVPLLRPKIDAWIEQRDGASRAVSEAQLAGVDEYFEAL